MRKDNRSGQLVFMYDLTPAHRHGKLEVLLPSGHPLIDGADVGARLRPKLVGFQPGDSLLCLGSPVAIAAASAIVAEVNDGKIPLLVWDRQLTDYLRIEVDTYGHRKEMA